MYDAVRGHASRYDDAPSGQVWYVAIQGRPYGPLTLARVVELAQLGAIAPDTYAWRVGLVTWYPLEAFTLIRRILGPVRPPTAPIVVTPALRRTWSQYELTQRAA